MGCIYSKKEGLEKKRSDQLPSLTDEDSKKYNGLNRIDTCSTIATNSARLMRSKYIKRLFLIQKQKNNRIMIKNIIFKQSPQLPSTNFNFLLRPPFINYHQYQIKCQEDHISIYTQMIYGFPQENIVLLSSETFNTKKSISQSKYSNILNKPLYFILRENVSIFIKMLLCCQQCQKLTKITHCTTVFNLNYSNCNCNCDNVAFIILRSEPENIRIWCDQLENSLSCQSVQISPNSWKLVNKQTRLRVIGCTFCWSFTDIKRRSECGCSVCDRCIGTECEICKI